MGVDELPVVVAQVIVLLVALVWLPLFARRSRGDVECGAVGLPVGTVRAMIAIMAIGSYVNLIVLGERYLADAYGDAVDAIEAIGLVIVGYYFGAGRAGGGPGPPPPPAPRVQQPGPRQRQRDAGGRFKTEGG